MNMECGIIPTKVFTNAMHVHLNDSDTGSSVNVDRCHSCVLTSIELKFLITMPANKAE